jgi:hypothetical protein
MKLFPSLRVLDALVRHGMTRAKTGFRHSGAALAGPRKARPDGGEPGISM